jgi:translation initiation factor IF-3
MAHADADPKLIGRNIHVMLTPLPANKRKPKFITPSEAEEEPADDSSAPGAAG